MRHVFYLNSKLCFGNVQSQKLKTNKNHVFFHTDCSTGGQQRRTSFIVKCDFVQKRSFSDHCRTRAGLHRSYVTNTRIGRNSFQGDFNAIFNRTSSKVDVIYITIDIFKALKHLTDILTSDTDMYLKTAVIWTLGMIGQHSTEHARHICAGDAMIAMMDVRSKIDHRLITISLIFYFSFRSILRLIPKARVEKYADTRYNKY